MYSGHKADIRFLIDINTAHSLLYATSTFRGSQAELIKYGLLLANLDNALHREPLPSQLCINISIYPCLNLKVYPVASKKIYCMTQIVSDLPRVNPSNNQEKIKVNNYSFSVQSQQTYQEVLNLSLALYRVQVRRQYHAIPKMYNYL